MGHTVLRTVIDCPVKLISETVRSSGPAAHCDEDTHQRFIVLKTSRSIIITLGGRHGAIFNHDNNKN